MIPPALTLARGASYFATYRSTAFPVVDDRGRVVGILSLNELERAPRRRRAAARVGECADRDPALVVDRGEDVGRLLEHTGAHRPSRCCLPRRRLLGRLPLRP